jgi:hypothetical protein
MHILWKKKTTKKIKYNEVDQTPFLICLCVDVLPVSSVLKHLLHSVSLSFGN